MTFAEAKELMVEARRTEFALNEFTAEFAGFIVGRLRRASTGTLVKLKKELRDFNIHTGEWK